MFGECHGHIFMNGRNYREAVETHKGGVCKEAVREALAAYQERGISFFREGGDYLGVSSYAKEIAPEYGIDYRSPVFAIHRRGGYGGIVGLAYDNMKEYHDLVLRAADEGADFIKVMFSGILDFGCVGKLSHHLTEYQEMKEVVHIAHEEGFSVMVHVNSAEAVGNALLAGVDSIEHGNYMTDEEIALLKEKDAIWVPTIAPYGNLIGRGLFPDETLKEIVGIQTGNVRKALKMGVHVALGADSGAVGVPHGSGLLDEYAFMKAAADGNEAYLNKILGESEELVRLRFLRR